MALDRIYQLDPTSPTSNSNFAGANIAESCAPSGINNALRSLGTMVVREFAYKAPAISASVSTNIVTSGLYVPISGANAINSLGVVPGEHPESAVFRFLEFSSSASLSHGPALRLVGGASRKTQPGDIGGYLHVDSGDSWVELFFSRATGSLPMDSLSVTTITNRSMSTSAISTVTLNAASASISSILLASINSNSISASVGEFTLLSAGGRGAIVNQGRATNATYTTCATDLPIDNSIPQITEGDEILSLTVTPTNASSIIRLRFSAFVGATAQGLGGAALFVDSTAGALAATGCFVGGTTALFPIGLEYTESAASTAQRIYRIRVGPDVGGPVSIRVNGDSSARVFGGVAAARLEAEEILP